MAELVYLVVYHRLLLDISVGRRHIGLRLIIIVIRNEVVHRVIRKKLAKFVRKLGGQGLVMGDDERRLLDFGYHVRNCEGLTGTRNAQKSLVLIAFFKAGNQFLYRPRLISARSIIRF